MRAMLCVLTSMLILALGTAASLQQSRNFQLAQQLDDRQRMLELTRMFILNAEAAILSAEARSQEEMLVQRDELVVDEALLETAQ